MSLFRIASRSLTCTHRAVATSASALAGHCHRLSSLSSKTLGAKQSQRWVHDYAPAAVTSHLVTIRRHAAAFPDDCRPNNAVDCHLETEDVQAALGNFERVCGVNRDDACELLQYAPESQLEGWVSRLLTWKDIQRGKDLFLPSFGGFNVARCLEDQILDYRTAFAMDFVWLFKPSYLREQCTKLKLAGATRRRPVSHVRETLSACKDLDLVTMLLAPDTKRKKRDFVFETRSSIPLFVSATDHQCKESILWQYFFSGGVGRREVQTGAVWSTPFWLPTVSELRCRGYFGSATFASNEDRAWMDAFKLLTMLSKPEDYPQGRYLLQCRSFCDNSDNIRAFVDALNDFDDKVWEKLGNQSNDLPPPERLAAELQRVVDSDCYEHLENLPDHGRLRVLRNKRQILEKITHDVWNKRRLFLSASTTKMGNQLPRVRLTGQNGLK